MLEWVYLQVRRSRLVTRVVIATDDQRIFDASRAFGAEVQLTNPQHSSGTERVAEVAGRVTDAGIIVNVQGDEPFIEPDSIDAAILPILEGAGSPVATLKTQLSSSKQAANPNVVKVVTDKHGRALYFSRAAIPFIRDAADRHLAVWFKHLGLYVFERKFLLGFGSLPRGPLENLEKLEQLRVLENGYSIHVVETTHDSVGVDTEEDLVEARRHAQQLETLVTQGAKDA